MDPVMFAGTGLVILGLVVWVVCAVYAYRNAPRFGRSPVRWGILGIIFGPIALMVLYVLPKGQREIPGSGGGRPDPQADLYQVPRKK